MGFGLLMREAGVCRFPQDAPDQPGALTTFEDIATRQEPEMEEQPGLHSTVRQRSATSPSLLALRAPPQGVGSVQSTPITIFIL